MSRNKRILLIAVCIVLASSLVWAHEGLHEQIAAITAKIKRDPKNASLYLQRGELHRFAELLEIASRSPNLTQFLLCQMSSFFIT